MPSQQPQYARINHMQDLYMKINSLSYECALYRAILDGAEYENLDSLQDHDGSLALATAIGKAAAARTKEWITRAQAAEEKVAQYESALANPGSDQRHMGTSTAAQLVHCQHMREKAEASLDALRHSLLPVLVVLAHEEGQRVLHPDIVAEIQKAVELMSSFG